MRVLVFDTETTGLTMPSAADLKAQPRIIELALAVVEHGKIISEHEWLINPEQQITAEITKITGITNEMVKGKPKFRQLLGEIEDAFGGADILIAHNAPFDTQMLANELMLCERTGFPWPKETICTVQEYFHVKGRRLKLVELYEMKTGKEYKQTHRALDDVRALAEIVIAEGLA
jgi:DNA polymerase III epsilon subunit family exonuclease